MIVAFRPRVLLSDASASGRRIDYRTISAICRSLRIYVLLDITETSGLITGGLITSPFEYADIVVTGTRGFLRGPSGALIFSRRNAFVQRTDVKDAEELRSIADAIDQSVFPGHQGGPHNHAISAVAVALKQASTPTFKAYQSCAVENAEALADRLTCLGYHLNANHKPTYYLVVKLTAVNARWTKRVLDAIGIAADVVVEESELHLGTLAMTSRGFLPADFRWVADIIHKAVIITQRPSAPDTDTSLACSMCDSRILEIKQVIKERMDRVTRF